MAIDFTTSLTDDEMRSVEPRSIDFTDSLAPTEPAPATESGVEEPGFTQRVGERLNVRKGEVSQTVEDYESGEIGMFEAGTQVIGKGVAGSLLDVIGEGVNTAIQGVSYLIPDDTEQELVDRVKSGIEYLSNTDSGKAAITAIENGVDAWNEWKKENPQDAKTVESVVNIGMVFAPAKVKKNAKPTRLGMAAEKIDRAAAAQVSKRRVDFVDDLIMPKKTPKVRTEQALRTEEVGVGPFKKNVVVKTPREAEIAAEVNKIPGISRSKSTQGNLNVILKQNELLRNKLEHDLVKDTTIIPRAAARDRIAAAAKEVVDENITIVSDNALARVAERARDKAIQFLDEGISSPLGVLKARRKFDNWVKDSRKNALETDAAVGTLTASAKRIRNELNQIIEDNAKSTMVKDSLKRQSLLFDAIDNIAPKAADEYNTAVGRFIQNISKIVPVRNKAVQEVGVLVGMGGLGAMTKLAPWFTGVAGLTGVTVVGGKVVISPQMKRGVAKAIRLADRAISDSGNSAMRHQLRLDRGTMVELLKNAEVSDGTQEEQQ